MFVYISVHIGREMYMVVQILTLFGSVILGVLSGALGAYVIIKRTLSNVGSEQILPIIDDLLSETMQNTELQQKIYVIGGVLGQGIRQGVGLDKLTPSTRKKGGLLEQLIGGFIQGQLGGILPQLQQNQQQPQQNGEIKNLY